MLPLEPSLGSAFSSRSIARETDLGPTPEGLATDAAFTFNDRAAWLDHASMSIAGWGFGPTLSSPVGEASGKTAISYRCLLELLLVARSLPS